MKNWITLVFSVALLPSCSPWHEPPIPRPGEPGYDSRYGTPLPSPITNNRDSGPTNQPKPKSEPRPKSVSNPDPEPTADPAPKPKPKYPTATSIPGKDGHVFNPYTNDPVDVRGIPSGSLVTDPNDGEGRKFRVP